MKKDSLTKILHIVYAVVIAIVIAVFGSVYLGGLINCIEQNGYICLIAKTYSVYTHAK